MAVRTVTWTTNSQDFALGTVGGNWLVTMTGQADRSIPAPVPLVYTLLPGDYVCTVQRLDSNAVPLGTPATASFTVVATTSPVDVPTVVTVA
jgi:hypothetical protein